MDTQKERSGASGPITGSQASIVAEASASSSSAASPKPVSKKIGTFQALSTRDFRLLLTGTLFTSAGQWIQQATLGWVVYDMTSSNAMVGVLNGIRSIPMLLLAPIGGTTADRVNRRLMMLVSQFPLMFMTFGLGLLFLLTMQRVSYIFAFMFLVTLIQVFNNPVRQTVVFDLVPRELVSNAVALNTVATNITRVLGPSIAGFLIASVGPAGNFFIQSAAYVGVFISTTMIVFPAQRQARTKNSFMSNLSEGLTFAGKDPLIRTLLIVAMIPALFLVPAFSALLPGFTKEVLGRGASSLGLMLSAVGLGGVLGALFIASISTFERRGLLQLAAISVMALAVFGLAFSRSLYVAMPLLTLVGFCEMIHMTTNQTLIQLSVPDHIRGRITSLIQVTWGLMPLGSLVAGTLAEVIGITPVMAVLAAISLSLALFILIAVPRMRDLRMSRLAGASYVNHAE